MKKEILFSLKSPYREQLDIIGIVFPQRQRKMDKIIIEFHS